MEIPQNPQSKPVSHWWTGGMLVFSFLGFLDASYLTAKHYLHFEVPCSILNGCEQVLTSEYADVWGVPVALFGALYYLSVLLLVVAYLDRKNSMFLKGAVLLPITGFAATLWFVAVQIFLLNAFCFYCMVSAGLTTLLFALSLHFIWHGYYKGLGRKGSV